MVVFHFADRSEASSGIEVDNGISLGNKRRAGAIPPFEFFHGD
jgi:hypothetical protein